MLRYRHENPVSWWWVFLSLLRLLVLSLSRTKDNHE